VNADLPPQGFHYPKPGLVDATVDLLRPELVMYEPQRVGSLQLIAMWNPKASCVYQ
jgi:hypothetical protein